MGASVSTNYSKAVVNAVSKIASEIVQTSSISQSSSQIISVTNASGDVVISGNRMTQRVNVNMSVLLDAMSTEQAQQNLATELAQQAKALTSGLNIGQLAVASNSVDTLVQATIDVVSKIGQTCSTLTSESQRIVVQNVVGSVRIENNVQEQMTEIMQRCVGNAIANNVVVQDVTTKLSQSASATAAGLSEWILVAGLAVLIGTPVIGGVVGGKALLRYLFPLITVAGVASVVVYFYRTDEKMAIDAYSRLIEETPSCLGEKLSASDDRYETAEEASDACSRNEACVAFDWKGLDVKEDGSYVVLNNPLTTLYGRVSDACRSSVQRDGVKTVRAPVVYSGVGRPESKPNGSVKGDVYVDETTSEWYQWDRTGSFQPKGVILHERFDVLKISGSLPPATTTSGGEYYVYANPVNPEYWHVYRNDNGRWTGHTRVPGPGMFASSPSTTNVSGYKPTTSRGKSWLLYGGICAIVVGAIGTVYSVRTTPDEETVRKV